MNPMLSFITVIPRLCDALGGMAHVSVFGGFSCRRGGMAHVSVPGGILDRRGGMARVRVPGGISDRQGGTAHGGVPEEIPDRGQRKYVRVIVAIMTVIPQIFQRRDTLGGTVHVRAPGGISDPRGGT